MVAQEATEILLGRLKSDKLETADRAQQGYFV